MNALEQTVAAVADELASEGIPAGVAAKVVAVAAARIRAGAYRDAAAVALRDAKACPDGCTTPLCRSMNEQSARWLTALADNEDTTSDGDPDVLPLWMFSDWLASGKRGVSSEAIVSQLTRQPVGRHRPDQAAWGDYPRDSSDFGRCKALLVQYPSIRPVFDKLMPQRSPRWAALVARWDDIDALYTADIDAGQIGSRAATQLIEELVDSARKAT